MSVLNYTSLTTHWASWYSVVKNPNAGDTGNSVLSLDLEDPLE